MARVYCTNNRRLPSRTLDSLTNKRQQLLTLGRVRRMHVNILALGAEELDRLYMWLVSQSERHHRLPSAQEMRTVAKFLCALREVQGDCAVSLGVGGKYRWHSFYRLYYDRQTRPRSSELMHPNKTWHKETGQETSEQAKNATDSNKDSLLGIY